MNTKNKKECELKKQRTEKYTRNLCKCGTYFSLPRDTKRALCDGCHHFQNKKKEAESNAN